MITRVKGWVSPRYLDPKWFKNFTISRDLRKNTDIQVIVEFCHDSYKSYMNDNELVEYNELEELNKKQTGLLSDMFEDLKSSVENKQLTVSEIVFLNKRVDYYKEELGIK